MDKKVFFLHLKIGIIKDLYAKGFLTKSQMEQALKKLLSRGRGGNR